MGNQAPPELAVEMASSWGDGVVCPIDALGLPANTAITKTIAKVTILRFHLFSITITSLKFFHK
jgi:hypothetical protein